MGRHAGGGDSGSVPMRECTSEHISLPKNPWEIIEKSSGPQFFCPSSHPTPHNQFPLDPSAPKFAKSATMDSTLNTSAEKLWPFIYLPFAFAGSVRENLAAV